MTLEEMEEDRCRFAQREARVSVSPVAIVDRRSPKRSASKSCDDLIKAKNQIAETRRTNSPGFEKNARVVDLLKTALKKRADFFHDDLRG